MEVSGLRPGEKLFEELSVADENSDKTRHPKIFVGRIRPHGMEEVLAGQEALLAAAGTGNGEAVRAALGALVQEYRPAGPEGAGADAETSAA